MPPTQASDSALGYAHRHVRSVTRKLTAQVLSYFALNADKLLLGMIQRLLDLVQADRHHLADQIKHWKDARIFLERNAKAFNAALQVALEKSLNDEVQRILSELDDGARHGGKPADILDSLSLVEAEEMDRILFRDQLVQRFNTRHEEALASLNQHMRVLFRREVANLQGNPYRPEVLVRAFCLALRNSAFDEDAIHDVLRAVDPNQWIDLGPLYAELGQALSQSGIEVTAHRVRKAAGDDGLMRLPAAPGHGDPVTTGFSGFSSTGMGPGYTPAQWTTTSHARDFLRQLGVAAPPLHARFPGAVADPGAPVGRPAPAPARGLVATQPFLLDYLEALQASVIASLVAPDLDLDLGQQNVLREMREREEIQGARELDRGTVDALAEVFDFVFADPFIPSALKFVIGRLQIPVLKAAMIDREFFFSGNHPARKLIDALAAAAVAWTPEKGQDDPLYVAIEAAVKRVLKEFEEDLALFGEVLLEFEDFLAQEQRLAQQQVDSVADAQAAEEALDAARARADEELLRRVQVLPSDLGSTAFLLPFLTTQWREVLARAWVDQTSRPDDWTRLLETTDQLLWSTQRKRDSAERRRLIAVLPELVRQLNASLDALGWSGEERENFTRRLIATHMNALRSTADPTQDAQDDATQQRVGAEAISTLDQRVAAARAEEGDDWDTVVQGLERGTWFDFLNDEGHSLRCRLTWISPKRTRFLFTNREGFDALVRSEHEVRDWLHQGRLTIISQASIVTRALDMILTTPEASSSA